MISIIRNILLWTYGRGTLQYDLMCALILAFVFLTPKAFLLGAEQPALSVDQVLSKMEATGKDLHTFSAEIVQKKYIAVLEEFDIEEKGTLVYSRGEDGSAMIRKEITDPAHTIAIVNRDRGLVYQPKIKQARRFELGQHKDKAEFMAIGIGGSAGKLKENFNVRVVGRDSVDGQHTTVLELRPKSEKTSAFLTVIKLWLDEKRWIPIQTSMQEPNEDYLLTRFVKIKLNPKIPTAAFSLQLPADVEVIG